MFYGNNVRETRQPFFTSWQKYREKKPLEPLEQQLVAVILDHPEYHSVLDASDIEKDYSPEREETNPFLHMALHLAVRDQLSTDRPAGIVQVYKKLLKKYADPLQAEHHLMEVLVDYLWRTQRSNSPPDENDYIASLRSLV